MVTVLSDDEPGTPVRRGLPVSLVVIAGYTAIAAWMTWPLLGDLGTRLGGDRTDPFQTLWGFWWWRHAITGGVSPMFTRLLWWPEGVPLWFQTFDLPSTLVSLPLGAWFPPFVVHNLLLFATFPLSGFTAYLLCRELWGGRLAPFLAGCLYTFSTFHFGQALANLHVVSMEWSPLFLFGLVRTIRRDGYAGPVIAGVGLAGALMASVYHFVFCLTATALLAAFHWAYGEHRVWSRGFLRRLAVLAAVFAALAGWLVIGMLRAYRAEPWTGQHDPIGFSADLQSFFFINAASAWARRFPSWRVWTGGQWVAVAYMGYVALALSAAAAWRHRIARGFLFVAAIGALLALGPVLQIGGVPTRVVLPYAWLEHIPGFAFGGLPSRFAWLTTFGIAVAACGTLARWCARGRAGSLLAISVVVLSLAETWPHAFTMSTWPSPPVLAGAARDPAQWVVLDATAWPRALWHQMLHEHPMLGGYVTRVPDRLWQKLRTDPMLAIFYPEPIGFASLPDLPVAPDVIRRRLADLDVHLVIVDEDKTKVPDAVGLEAIYRGDGIVVYQGPPAR